LAAGLRTFGYDANGSLISNGTKAYDWDGQNRLVRVLDNSSEVARFAYDGLGRRAQRVAAGVTRTYVYGGEDVIEERLNSGGTVRYIHGPDIDQPLASVDAAGTKSYLLADHLGSIVQTTNSSAAVTLTRQYDAYGNLSAGSGAAGYAFTGREWDAEIGLYYYRARYYDPQAARFISEDPSSLGGGTNLYSYVRNAPTTWMDPFGLKPCIDKYKTIDQAALNALSDARRTSRSKAIEFAGVVYMNKDKTYSYSPAYPGTPDTSDTHWSDWEAPDRPVVGTYHTHPPLPGYDGENFSRSGAKSDIQTALGLSAMLNRDISDYLATPSGAAKRFDPGSGVTQPMEPFPWPHFPDPR
jgi:RHS repeat-associated protein